MIGRKEAIRSLEWDLEKGEPQFVAVYGLSHNKHWGVVQSELTLDDLFQP